MKVQDLSSDFLSTINKKNINFRVIFSTKMSYQHIVHKKVHHRETIPHASKPLLSK